MKKACILLFVVSLLAACGKTGSPETGNQNADSIPVSAVGSDTTENAKAHQTEKSDIDFLSVCDSLEIWQGAIQGVPQSDSTGIYILAQCASNKSFDVVVYSEREIALSETVDDTKGALKNNIADAVYYAFEIPKHKSINLEEELDTYDYFFPCDVRVYKRFEDGWYLIHTKRVETFEQLGRLKLNTIFN